MNRKGFLFLLLPLLFTLSLALFSGCGRSENTTSLQGSHSGFTEVRFAGSRVAAIAQSFSQSLWSNSFVTSYASGVFKSNLATDLELNSYASSAGVLSGGGIINAYSQFTPLKIDSVSVPNEGESVSMLLENGSYRFYGVGYIGGGLQTIRCGVQQETLSGLYKDIAIPVSSAGCNSPVNGFSYYFDASSNLLPLKIHDCINAGALVLAPCGGACGACGNGTLGSVKVVLTSYQLRNSVITAQVSGTDPSICVNMVGAAEGSATIENPIIPLGNRTTLFDAPYVHRVYGYAAANCAGNPSKTYNFNAGIQEADGAFYGFTLIAGTGGEEVIVWTDSTGVHLYLAE